jgi:MFS transporter, PAT family, beta-lactamase induction signal transducer AmpG
MPNQTTSRSPWVYIPTLYFAEGVPYIIINAVSVIFYKKLGINNTEITLWTSFISLPWVLKMFWAPFVDIYSTKRKWLLTMQFAIFCCLGAIAFSLQLPNFFFISLVALTIGAFISATYDIATDGFYLIALSPEQQAFFVGIRSLFYRLAVLFGNGILPLLAGLIEKNTQNIPLSWTLAISSSALILAIFFIFHNFILPKPEPDKKHQYSARENIPILQVIGSYFQQEKIGYILAFILLYRLGEAMLLKIAPLFLLDTPDKGGLGLSTIDYSSVYGTFGVISLIVGGILGGAVISRYGLKKWLFPMALAMNLPNLFYVYMAYAKPALKFVYPLVSLEQFGYGFGFTAFSVYLMYVSKGEYKTSHFAISTGIMALGLMLPGAISGYLQQTMGYPSFFVLVCLLTIPGMIALFFIPLSEDKILFPRRNVD